MVTSALKQPSDAGSGPLLQELGLTGLRIQRMPGAAGLEFNNLSADQN
jgi:hypothetical protein